MHLSKILSTLLLFSCIFFLTHEICVAQSSQECNAHSKTDAREKNKPILFSGTINRVKKIADIINCPKQKVTLKDLKLILPKNSIIKPPVWTEEDIATGNVSELEGPILGVVVF